MGFAHKKPPCPPPKNVVGARVICLSRILRQEFNNAINELGLFSGQQDIVLALVENEGVTLSELAKMLDVSAATASISIKRMEKSGFIEKRPDEKDARIIRLYPTELAKKTPEIIKEHIDNMDKRLKQDMSEEEALELSRLLEIAIKNLSKGCDNDA